MKTRTTCALGSAAILLAGSLLVPSAASAAPAPEADTDAHAHAEADRHNRPDPLADKRSAVKKRAAELVATGDAEVQTKGKGKTKSNVVELRPGEYVEYGTAETAQLFTILAEFSDMSHNEIPEPEADDNSTYWEPDFSRAHFEDMFFGEGESFTNVYEEMSSGRFTVEGGVSDWVQLPGTAATYGANAIDPETGEDLGETNAAMTQFIQDSGDAWYEAQLAAGKTEAEIVAELKSYDVWDRYDQDFDGIINEPDGYIDHFQAVHAGEGEEAGAPTDAIWSHRWAANPRTGREGPSAYPKLGGVEIGDTDIWIRDYTTEPENGGLGVFAHEFGHDLGLPDFYDTAAGGDNGTAFWTLMSSGSWLGHGDGTIGTTPNQMGPTEKLFLGWLDYEVVDVGTTESVKLGPAYHASTLGAQAVIVDLPDGTHLAELEPSPEGAQHLYSGSGNDLNNTATSPVFTVPSGATFTAQVKYEIEKDWDYAFLEVTTDGGATWDQVETNLSTTLDPNDQNVGFGITGTVPDWTALTADLSAYAGSEAQVRVRYWTDVAAVEEGFQIDAIQISGLTATDGADDWTLDGFQRVIDGKYEQSYSHFYIAENRVYGGYDKTLRTGPYNFGWQVTAPDKVEHFPYQDGLLVWYVNSLYADNNTSQHPGGGESLPVDARAKALTWSDGTIARNRIQTFDATFGLHKTDPISLHRETEAGMTTLKVGAQKPIATFDDTDPNRYYDETNPKNSVKVGGTGTKITVTDQNVNRGTMTVLVDAAG